MRAICIIMVLLATALAAAPGTAAAHAEIVETQPAEAAVVGGTIDQITLQFVGLSHPGQHVVSLTGPDGEPVATNGGVAQNLQRLTLFLASPLSEPGDYRVNLRVDALDGDTTIEEFVFTFDEDAPPPAPLTRYQIGDTGGRSGLVDGLIVFTAVFATLVIAWIARRLWMTR